MKIPALIQEQNSHAGITNKILAKRVQRICVAYEEMEKYFPKDKIMITGNPVRMDIVQSKGNISEALKFFGFIPGRKTLLVIGGSLGARTINESIKSGLNKLINENIQVIWQTGKLFFPQAQELLKGMESKNILVFDFIRNKDARLCSE